MKELDLHGLKHFQVRDEVENFVLLNAKELPIRIIIGSSMRMKNLTEILGEQGKTLEQHIQERAMEELRIREAMEQYDLPQSSFRMLTKDGNPLDQTEEEDTGMVSDDTTESEDQTESEDSTETEQPVKK